MDCLHGLPCGSIQHVPFSPTHRKETHTFCLWQPYFLSDPHNLLLFVVYGPAISVLVVSFALFFLVFLSCKTFSQHRVPGLKVLHLFFFFFLAHQRSLLFCRVMVVPTGSPGIRPAWTTPQPLNHIYFIIYVIPREYYCYSS